VFSSETWRETARVQFATVGFPKNKESTARRVVVGDVFICYLLGHAAFVGALEVSSSAQIVDEPRIWSADIYPVRFSVRPLVALREERAVSVYDLLSKLEFSLGMTTGTPAWGGYFQSPPKRLKGKNGEVILEALKLRARCEVKD
jgi:hypothetical protein